jgi:hypothetical protein
MSRGEQNRTDGSLPEPLKDLAITTLQAAGDLLRYRLFSDDEIQTSKPEVILNRMLSTKSYILTTSSNAAINQQAHEDLEQRIFNQIGSGQCGKVYALIGTTQGLKVPNQGKTEALWNDAQMHKQVEEAFGRTALELRQQINIPRFGQWVLPRYNFLARVQKFFPAIIQASTWTSNKPDLHPSIPS